MRILINVAIVFLLVTPAFVQAQNHEQQEEKTKEEIQRLFRDLNEGDPQKGSAAALRLVASL